MGEGRVGLIDSLGIMLVAFVWGVGYLMGAKSVETASFPSSTAAVRFGFGLLLMGGLIVPGFMLVSPTERAEIKNTIFNAKTYRSFLMESIGVGAIYHVFGGITAAWSLSIVPSGVAAVLFSLEPIVAGMTLATLGERTSFLSREGMFGSFISLVGVFMVVWPNIQADLNDPNAGISQVLGTAIAIFSTCCYGVGVGLSKRLADKRMPEKTSALLTVAGQLLTGLIGSIFASLVLENSGTRFFEGFTTETFMWLLGIALFPTCICWVMFAALVRRVGAKASLYAFLVPPVSMVAGALFNDEWDGLTKSMKTIQVFGLIIDVLGLMLVLRRDIFEKEESTSLVTAPGGAQAPKDLDINKEIVAGEAEMTPIFEDRL